MKSRITMIGAIVFLLNCQLNAQKLSADSINSALNDIFDPNNLPGTDPDIGIPDDYPFPEPPQDPDVPELPSIEGDISVTIEQNGPIVQQQCNDSFVVKYNIIAKNLSAAGPITFKVSEINDVEGQQHGVNNYPTNLITVPAGGTVTLPGTVKLSYPFTLVRTRNSVTKFYQVKRLTMTVKTVGGFKAVGTKSYILDDQDPSNNQHTITTNTPLPAKCIRTSQQTAKLQLQ